MSKGIKPVHWAGLAVITVVGAWFRLNDLGAAALRADTIHFWTVCRMPISGWAIITRWTELGVGQMPLPLAVTKWYIDLFGVEATEFHLRLPNALFGIGLIPVVFAVARRMGHVWTGLLAALLLALNPFHIQLSMEAYFYSSLILGAGLLLLGAVQAAEARVNNAALPWQVPWLSGLGFLLVAYSQVTGWVVAALLMGATLFLVVQNRKAHADGMRDLRMTLITYGVVGAPLLFVSWGLPHMFEKLRDRSQVEMGQEVVELMGDNAFTLIYRMTTSMAWGESGVRLALLTVAWLAGVSAFVALVRARRVYVFVPIVIAAHYFLFLASRSAFGALYESRYLAGLLPIYIVFLALGVAGPHPWLPVTRRPTWVPILQGGFTLLIVLALLGPAYAANQLSGKPTPYKDIVEVANRELPAGAPVLVDRWFEPWNEMKVYPSTNVVFTFTVPNEPLRTFREYRWRDTAIQFFLRHPDAAYLELAKTYHEVPDIGPWDWPRQFFKRHRSIRNEAGLRLRALGLAARGDFYAANTNRLVAELFFNTRADVMERLAREGVEWTVWFDGGWRFVKSGPFPFLEIQTEQLMEWRMMNERAEWTVVNLTDQPARVLLRARVVALNGAKQVVVADSFRKRFPANVMEVWDIGPLTLSPGLTTIGLRDPAGGATAARLLVERVEVLRVPEE